MEREEVLDTDVILWAWFIEISLKAGIQATK
jgi:hypothetical protein